jgi:hypothetical protein
MTSESVAYDHVYRAGPGWAGLGHSQVGLGPGAAGSNEQEVSGRIHQRALRVHWHTWPQCAQVCSLHTGTKCAQAFFHAVHT